MPSAPPLSVSPRFDDQERASSALGAVAIGRNEGERLRRCLVSLQGMDAVVYVDSGSSDGSLQWAREHGVDVVELDMTIPFTAARARNAGYSRLLALAPHLRYVQFVDGDCELNGNWCGEAVSFLNSHPEVGGVCGRRRERYPEKSIYNWMCDREWDRPAGEIRAFGGDVMLRTAAFQAVDGYRDDVIAAEDDELSIRLRAAGWRLWRLPSEMTLHDAAMTRFGQYWQRAVRCGYAFALGAYLHGASPERHFVWESRRAWLWGVGLPIACLLTTFVFPRWGWATWIIYPLQLIRQTLRNSGTLRQRAALAFFQLVGRFAEVLGQIKFMRDRLLRRRARIIEYK